jgi:hypothetical protein
MKLEMRGGARKTGEKGSFVTLKKVYDCHYVDCYPAPILDCSVD